MLKCSESRVPLTTEVMTLIELQDVFTRFSRSYLASNKVHYEGLKAIQAICHCRTAELGGHVDVCDGCQASKISYNPVGIGTAQMREREEEAMDSRPNP